MSISHSQLWFLTVWFSFFIFCIFFFFLFSIHRGIRGTISWSIWSSEHWCRSLGNARKAKQWLWCVISHKQPQWQEFIKGHLAVVLQNLFSQFSNFLRHHMYFFHLLWFFSFVVTFFSNIFIFIFWCYLLFALSKACCACSAITVISIILSGFGFL